MVARLSDQGPGAARRLERQLATGQPFVLVLERPFVTDVERFLAESGKRGFRASASSFQLPLESKRVKLGAYHRALSEAPPRDAESAPIPYVFHDLLGNDDLRERRTRDRWRASELKRWWSRCPPPEFFLRMSKANPAVAARVAFGPAGTHSGLHRHGASTCQVVFGSKRWTLHEADVTSRLKPIIEALCVPCPQIFWWNHVIPKIESKSGDVRRVLRGALLGLAKRGLFDATKLVHLEEPLDAAQVIGERFTQRGGEIVYLPPFWGHATMNDDWTLAFVMELRGERAMRERMNQRAMGG